MLVAVVFFFFACIMPFKVLTFWIVTSPTEILDVVSEETYFNLVILKLLSIFESPISPLNQVLNPPILVRNNTGSDQFQDCKGWF